MLGFACCTSGAPDCRRRLRLALRAFDVFRLGLCARDSHAGARGHRQRLKRGRCRAVASVARPLTGAMARAGACVMVGLVVLVGCGGDGAGDRGAEPAAKRLAGVLQAKLDAKRDDPTSAG